MLRGFLEFIKIDQREILNVLKISIPLRVDFEFPGLTPWISLLCFIHVNGDSAYILFMENAGNPHSLILFSRLNKYLLGSQQTSSWFDKHQHSSSEREEECKVFLMNKLKSTGWMMECCTVKILNFKWKVFHQQLTRFQGETQICK